MGMPFNVKKSVNKDVVEKCVKYIESNEKYSFYNILNNFGLLKDAKQQGENLLIACPFHEDFSPSLSINLEKRIYKCFSCDRGGGYFQFLISYNREIIGNNINYYSLIDSMLKNDVQMQMNVNAQTVFESIKSNKEIIYKRIKPNLKIIDEVPSNYIDLANKMKRDSMDTENNILLMITLMQSGMKASEIFKSIYNDKSSDSVSRMDLDLSKLI